jgi:hypothetical protein
VWRRRIERGRAEHVDNVLEEGEEEGGKEEG